MRILIAEDDLTSRKVLAAVLKKGGHDVIETVNGLEAWKILQQADAPSLVILDWMMREMDGLEGDPAGAARPVQNRPTSSC